MSRVLPILFNGDMVRAILDGRKTATRRVVRHRYSNTEMKMRTDKYGTRLIEIQHDIEGETFGKNDDGSTWHKLRGYVEPKPPYQQEDILYVRETWLKTDCFGLQDGYFYKANATSESERIRIDYGFKWHPSIHMPKAAARIWLKVTDVRVERLQDITEEQVAKEGIKEEFPPLALDEFRSIWDSTIKKADIDCYGWNSNCWVWVIEFERCEKLEIEE